MALTAADAASIIRTVRQSLQLDRLLASAIEEIDPMAGEKMKIMAAMSGSLPRKLDALADKAMTRMQQLDTRGAAAFEGVHKALDGVEDGVRVTEEVLAQLSASPGNGGPPLDGSASSDSASSGSPPPAARPTP